MLKCRDVAERGSQIIDRQLDFAARLAVLAHLALCPRCRLYIRQLRLTRDTLQQLPLEEEPDPATTLEAIRRRKPSDD